MDKTERKLAGEHPPAPVVTPPIGQLMTEHRLIERGVAVLARERDRMRRTRSLRPHVIERLLDFIRMYADRTHHAKEEDILFVAMASVGMSADDKAMMAGLTGDHNTARSNVRRLDAARERWLSGDTRSVADAIAAADELAALYPRHIEMEDNHFFVAVNRYLGPQESEDMLRRFWESDRRMIHEKYMQEAARLEHLAGQ